MKQRTIYTIIFSLLLCVSHLISQTSLAETAFQYGRKLYDEKFYDLAILQLQDFIEQYETGPDAAEAHYLLGESQFALKMYQDAQKSFLAFVVRFPDREECPVSYFRIAQCFFYLNQIESAIVSFHRVYDFYPDHPMGHEGLFQAAVLYTQNHETEQARAVLKRLETLQLSYDLLSRTQFMEADLYISQKQYESALQILKPLRESGINKKDRVQSAMKMAEIYNAMGRFDLSRTLYLETVKETNSDSLKQIIHFNLGSIDFRSDRMESAKRHFKLSTALHRSVSLTSAAFGFLGMIAEKEKHFGEAVLHFEKAAENSEHQLDYSLKTAKIYFQTGDTDQAENQLQMILDAGRIDDTVYSQALLYRAKTSVMSKKLDQGTQYYQKFMECYPSNALIPFIEVRLAELYIRRGLVHLAWTILRRLWEAYPGSNIAPRAYFLYARSLKREGDRREADRVYHLISDQYPGSVYADSAGQHDLSAPSPSHVDSETVLGLQALLSKALHDPDDPQHAFQYAKILIEELHLYLPAIPWLMKCTDHDILREDAFYYLGVAYRNLSVLSNSKSYQDSSALYFNRILSSYGTGTYAVNSALAYSEMMSETISQKIRRLKPILNQTTEPQIKNRVEKLLGQYYLNLDSLDQAYTSFQKVLTQDSGHTDILSSYYTAAILLKKGETESADALFEKLLNENPHHPMKAGMIFQRALMAWNNQNHELAGRLFQQIRNDYGYTGLADSACFYLGKLSLAEKQYQRAVLLFREVIQTDSLNSLAYDAGLLSFPPQKRSEVMILLAKAYEGLGHYEQAQELYFHYQRLYSNIPLETLYVYLARLSEKQENYNRAVQYLQAVLLEASADTLYMKVGLLHEKSGEYDQAYSAYQKALTMTKDSERQAVLNQKLILCLLKQDRMPAADARIHVFEKSFRKQETYDLLMAEIWFEKGMSHFRLKNFGKAEDLFARVRSKFKKTPFRKQAELEIGRTYIVTNKIDDALGLLTRMVETYKDDPIYYQIYLNLGDLYFRNRQFENALNAFKIVQSDSSHILNQQLASRYLIRIYETMGLWEAALALTRNYIRQFPEADDLLSKKVQIGNFYMRLKDYYRAIHQFKKVQLEADSETEAEIQYWIGKSYAEMGQFEQAILEYLKVKYISKPTKLPWGSTALYEAAMSYLKLYKPWEARILFEKIVRYEGSASDLGRIARQRIEEIDQGKYAEAE